jgi:hypothetical protein
MTRAAWSSGLLLAALACGGDTKQTISPRAAALPLGPGDARIVTVDSSMELALVGQRIVVRFGDRTMAQVRRETDTSAVRDSGFAGSIERMVKTSVQSALEHQIEYPLSEVRDARYEDGEIRLETKSGRLLDRTKVNGQPLTRSFPPNEARRFVAAVQARKRGG